MTPLLYAGLITGLTMASLWAVGLWAARGEPEPFLAVSVAGGLVYGLPGLFMAVYCAARLMGGV